MNQVVVRFLYAVLVASAAAPVMAHPEYQKGFLDQYTKGPGVDKDFRKLARSAKCYVCHQGKEDRTNYNRYGEALTAHLSEKDKKDKAKLAQALETVAAQPSDGEGSATFGELIVRGELPGGPLEECKKEPTGG
ncbi:hypothetical protein Pla108_03630 [Botrimarina colliarenosi]|uniref:Cytochrome c domain-containing protein n=1 Tax=Botrimarina colliarenosi TaxID=2528001 RepID=A0A5C6AJT4_9BACT|nr:hypothetical protein [Botrimarina colliarenosi]TWT99425.1 hypothetical protein Pla108_03630 [Botrimarina colliarenosi]